MILVGILIFAASYGLGFYRGLTSGTARWRREFVDGRGKRCRECGVGWIGPAAWRCGCVVDTCWNCRSEWINESTAKQLDKCGTHNNPDLPTFIDKSPETGRPPHG